MKVFASKFTLALAVGIGRFNNCFPQLLYIVRASFALIAMISFLYINIIVLLIDL